MANTVVKSAADTNTQMDNATLNPDVLATAGSNPGNRNRQVVHITLVVEGLTLTPDSVYDALDAQYAVVAGEKDSYSRGTWIFNVGPA